MLDSETSSMATEEAFLVTGCGLCKKPDALQQCPRCKAIRYCGREHQIEHRNSHHGACTRAAQLEQIVYAEEQILKRDHPEALNTIPRDVDMRHDYHIIRPYMLARYRFVEVLGQIHTRISVELQLGHLLDILKLCPSDNLNVRLIVPGLMMRLGQDQECYDFIKWWERRFQGLAGDEEDVEGPCLRATNNDSFESVGFMFHGFQHLFYLTHVTLLKTRLLFDLMALRDSEASNVSGKVPREILNIIQDCEQEVYLDLFRAFVDRSGLFGR